MTHKQGSKESVRNFINQLMFLARKAFGQDLPRREAAVLKRLDLGLVTLLLRRTFDDLMSPRVTLMMITSELMRRESQDELSRYQQYIIP